MPLNQKTAAAIGRYLRKSEELLAVIRATPRGGAMASALMAGAGAATGYLISTSIGEGAMAAAIGGGIGGASGVILASIVSYIRMNSKYGIRAAVVTVALTPKRLLLFRQSWLANRAAELVADYPIENITSVVVEPARLISPHPLTISFDNGETARFESAKVEKPYQLAEAYQGLGG